MSSRRSTEATHADCAWRVRLDDGASHTARFLVDATGRGAVLARQNGVRFENLDRLVGSVMLFEQATDDGTGLLIETFSDGWWYTAALPEGRRIVAAMSDADLVRALGLNRPDGFMRALGATQHVCRAVADARPLGSPVLRPAGSRHITRDTALPLLCVGDAASCFDPVSGQGIFKALRSGIFASYAIGDFLCRDDDTGLAALPALHRRRVRRLSQDAARVLRNGAALGRPAVLAAAHRGRRSNEQRGSDGGRADSLPLDCA